MRCTPTLRRTIVSCLVAAGVAACSAAPPERTFAVPEPVPPEADGRPAIPRDLGHEGKERLAAEAGEPRAPHHAKSAEKPPFSGTRPRIGALGPHTWIWKRAERSGLAIGKMRPGTSVALKSAEPIPGPGCKGRWYAIEPRGYVCLDNTATLDLDDPYFEALAFAAPDPGIWPYRYAHSNGTPMYGRVPKPSEWEDAERGFGPAGVAKRLGEWSKGHEELMLEEPIPATDPVPYFLEGGERRAPGGNYNVRMLVWRKMPAGSMLAYSKAFSMHGRVWLLTPDTMVVPADRVSPIRRSTFRGVYFTESDMRLPLAWNRSKEALPKYVRQPDGGFVPSGDTVAAKSPVEIQEGEVHAGGMVYYELRREPGRFIGKTDDPKKQLDAPVSVTRRAAKIPAGVGPDERWLEVKVVPGTLTAYVGAEPVMATLFSPGKGGPPVPGHDHSKYATTATGFFPIEWKERVATMSNEKGEPKVLWFSDVPHQQYLKAPLAMHVAYWHEDYGKRKSAECVNVSPFDGNWLFGFTGPDLPEGWNAVAPGNGNGRSTPIFVTAN